MRKTKFCAPYEDAAKYKKGQSAGALITGQTKNLKTLTTKKKKK